MNIIIDYDGTLHECDVIYAPAFRLAYHRLVELSYAREREWQNGEISRWLGYSGREMWNEFMPDLPQEVKDECGGIIRDEMLRRVRSGAARLYSGALDALRELRGGGHNLVFLSNCKREYMLANTEHFGLDEFFSMFVCAEDFSFRAKHEIFAAIKPSLPQGGIAVVGDRWQDMEIAAVHGLKFIACGYGYGDAHELRGADVTVSSVGEIPGAVELIKIGA